MVASLQELSLLVPISTQCPLPHCPHAGGQKRRYATSEIEQSNPLWPSQWDSCGQQQSPGRPDARRPDFTVSKTMIKNTDSQELSSNLYTRTVACVWTQTHTYRHAREFLKTEIIILFSVSLSEGNQVPGYSLTTKRSTWWPTSQLEMKPASTIGSLQNTSPVQWSPQVTEARQRPPPSVLRCAAPGLPREATFCLESETLYMEGNFLHSNGNCCVTKLLRQNLQRTNMLRTNLYCGGGSRGNGEFMF